MAGVIIFLSVREVDHEGLNYLDKKRSELFQCSYLFFMTNKPSQSSMEKYHTLTVMKRM